MTSAALQRRFLLLTALRWLPTGLLIPLTTIYLRSRGLGLAELGLVAAVQGIVVVVLEVPSGGFADALGHRRALVLAGTIDVASLALLLVAHDLTGFLAAWVLQGVFRALDSGPLEAWYVDAALDRGDDIERGLAAASIAVGVGISAGAAATALVVVTTDRLALPIAVALALRAVDVLLLRSLVTDRGTARPRIGAALRDTPAVVRRSLRTLRASRVLAALVGVELLWGAGMVPIELFAGPRLLELDGDATRAVATLGAMAAAAWIVQAGGAAATTRTVTAAGGPVRAAALLRVVQGAFVLLGAFVPGAGGLVGAYFGFYLVHGASNAVHYGLVHRAAPAGERATVLSLNSLASRLGGVLSGLALGALASTAGIPATFLVAGLVIAGSAPLYRVGRGHGAERPASGCLRARP